MSDRFYQELADVFEISEDALKDENIFVTDAPWDSLRVLSVISLVDEFFSVALSTTEIIKCKNPSEILNVVRGKNPNI